MRKKTITDEQISYARQSVFNIYKLRTPWLILLMLTNTFTSIILSSYEQKLSALQNGAMLYAFIPMLMGASGNAGGQTSVAVIRALALRQIQKQNAFYIIVKELVISILIAFSVSAFCFFKLMIIDSIYIAGITMRVALVVSLVLFISIITAKSVGCILPLLATKLHIDPAVVVGPFVCTIVDVLSLIFYCSTCVYLL